VNAAEALQRLGFVPLCDCDHGTDEHGKDGAHGQDGPCTGLDSYGAPCACPSYDVEPQPEDGA
jgi:hypothetical protein